MTDEIADPVCPSTATEIEQASVDDDHGRGRADTGESAGPSFVLGSHDPHSIPECGQHV